MNKQVLSNIAHLLVYLGIRTIVIKENFENFIKSMSSINKMISEIHENFILKINNKNIELLTNSKIALNINS